MTNWKLRAYARFLLLFMLSPCLDLGVSINDEGEALLKFKEEVKFDPYGALRDWKEEDVSRPCSWFGVHCYGGKVVALNLSNLGLEGKLAPEIGKLVHLKFLTLNNNSLSGVVPRELASLQNLELLDLEHNNFSSPLPPELHSFLSSKILLLESNRLTVGIPPELHGRTLLSKQTGRDAILGRALVNVSSSQASPENVPNKNSTSSQSLPPDKNGTDRKKNNHTSSAAPPSRHSPVPATSSSLPPPPRPHSPAQVTSPSLPPPPRPRSPAAPADKTKRSIFVSVLISAVGAVLFITILALVYMFYWRTNKIVTIKPWATGLSGQLQKAFVTGVPSLKRSEIEAACEDFSNIIGSTPGCRLFKGTLSSGVEIAVLSVALKSSSEWSKQSEAQFRKKITTLSKVNHKNFVNLIGYCEEEEPFTRMMVFEYAPNGTLFEHLHVKEAEQLEWGSRLRIAMGIAYCLEHLHQLNPPVILRNLDSMTIYLTDDYAAKISDLGIWNESEESEKTSAIPGTLAELSDMESIVHRFGILLLEILSGKLPFSDEDGALEHWASSYLKGQKPLKELIDPILLGSFNEEITAALCKVISSCIHQEPKERPTMQQVSSQLRGITLMPPDRATPKVSPLWWAELEMISPEAN